MLLKLYEKTWTTRRDAIWASSTHDWERQSSNAEFLTKILHLSIICLVIYTGIRSKHRKIQMMMTNTTISDSTHVIKVESKSPFKCGDFRLSTSHYFVPPFHQLPLFFTFIKNYIKQMVLISRHLKIGTTKHSCFAGVFFVIVVIG